jgi:AcrR family transcriptional regulator
MRMPHKQSSDRKRSPRVEKKREQARQEILETAQLLMRNGGVEAVTLASVAGELGMTKQAIYHYFPSKEALIRRLVTTLVDDEVNALLGAVEAADSGESTLGTLVRAFYDHYIDNLDALRFIYCQSQLYAAPDHGMDQDTVREEINPRTQHLFDELESRLSADRKLSGAKRDRLRRLAFTAWTSALGLLTMLGIADALDDPLVHSKEDLIDTLTEVFNNTVSMKGET